MYFKNVQVENFNSENKSKLLNNLDFITAFKVNFFLDMNSNWDST